jgi:crotonobetainyl-CoA:carnitine CoA-transferase CaiB-like acyl-CoA transferase
VNGLPSATGKAALSGVTVIDLCAMMPGQFAAMILGDLGARVIKVERPKVGDFGRHTVKGSHESVNRNKESITLDLKQPAAQEVLRRMVATADVLLEGYRPGVTARLGADYESLSAVNPRLVYCSLSGYGQFGPYTQRVGHDPNYLALAGVLWLAGDPNGPPEGVLGASMADLSGTYIAAISVLAALLARSLHGNGQYIDVALSDAAYGLMTSRMVEYVMNGRPSKAQVMARPGIGVFETEDGLYVSLAAVEDHFWVAFCREVGRDDWLNDPRLRTNAQRREHAQEIRSQLPDIFKTRTRDEWVHDLDAAGVCVSPVNDLGEALVDAHARAREVTEWLEHPVLGRIPQMRFPGLLYGTPATIRSRPPTLGEHTVTVLAGLGYSMGEIEELGRVGAT